MGDPLHIDDAVLTEDLARGCGWYTGWEPHLDAEFAARFDLARSIALGKIVTDDKQRADRMTRALERSAISYNDFDDGSGGFYRCGACNATSGIRRKRDDIPHARDCAWVAARQWVKENPE